MQQPSLSPAGASAPLGAHGNPGMTVSAEDHRKMEILRGMDPQKLHELKNVSAQSRYFDTRTDLVARTEHASCRSYKGEQCRIQQAHYDLGILVKSEVNRVSSPAGQS
jgi:hypothetical protein